MKDLGIYIHIPFCKSKCAYCDFCSYENCDNLHDDYFNALMSEIDLTSSSCDDAENSIVTTIFFGGGTPSLVSPTYIEKIINKINCVYNVASNAEITLEMNPGTVTEQSLKKYKEYGINRLSVGVQSFNDSELEILGRIHNSTEAIDTIKLAKKIGFNNINIDLMFGIPLQTLNSFENSINTALSLGIQHISSYSLSIEDGTRMEKIKTDNSEIFPTEDEEREMYYLIKHKLAENGFKHYEISNWSLNDYQCGHNLRYWNCDEYFGFGAAAASYICDKRISNVGVIEQYISSINNRILPVIEDETILLTSHEKMQEYVMLQFRLLNGVDRKSFYDKFNVQLENLFNGELNELVNEQLIVSDESGYKLTEKGLDFANQVFMRFV